MDPSISPSFWNNETHDEFKLELERPRKVPRLEITVQNNTFRSRYFEIIQESPKNTIKLVVKAGKDHCFEYKLAKGDQLAFHITGAYFHRILLFFVSINVRLIHSGNNNFGFAVVHADNEYENYVTA